ncbi:dynamin family protein [Escherichia coli]|nr:hypothetical protein [Escherichia coli]EFJ9426723.1 hypothetical protein [Escherichia coli]EFK3982574.1 hypothetical protein [Escherichia coli]EIP9919872.1 dynamin family protein [Escherichia coli]
MHEKNIALLCDEADRLLQLNINLLRQMVEEPDVLSDSKNENRLLFDKQKALKRIEELEGEQIKTARREMVLAVVGTMKAGKSTTINAIVGQEILPNRNRPMTSVPTLIRHVPGKTEPVLHLEHIQPVRNLLITLQEKLATPAGQQVAQTLQQTGDTRELLDILTDDGWLKNEYHGEEEIFTGLASLNDLVRLAAAMGTEFPFDEYAEVQKLPVIDVEFSHLVGMDACQGTLTLLDNRVCQVLTCLPEKFVVDFANGIDVAQEHIRTAGERTFFRRLKEGLTGEGAARQNAINASLAQGVEASLRWLTEMTTSLATTNYAITQVNDRVSSLVSDTARLAHYSADTREQLLTLADQVHHKLNHLEEKLHRVDQVQRAQLHLEQIFSWWSAGRYASFSPAGRCYVALEELRWGAFGDVIRQSETGQVNQLLDILRHKALTQMAQESGGSATVRLNTLDWLGGQGREQADNEWHDAINWLGDWCSEEQHPVIWSTTQAAEHLPVRMPRLCSAERLSESMVDEIFQKGAA